MLMAVFMNSCTQEVDYFPKPLAYARIDLPKERGVNKFTKSSCGYSFNYPEYAVVSMSGNCNHNIYFPRFKAVIYCTYITLDPANKENNFVHHSEYSRRLAYEHSIKADEITETKINVDSTGVYGILYGIEGNVASNCQFYLTDSIHNFYRGSLYFESAPNIDSIQPVLEYLREDVKKMINSFNWK